MSQRSGPEVGRLWGFARDRIVLTDRPDDLEPGGLLLITSTSEPNPSSSTWLTPSSERNRRLAVASGRAEDRDAIDERDWTRCPGKGGRLAGLAYSRSSTVYLIRVRTPGQMIGQVDSLSSKTAAARLNKGKDTRLCSRTNAPRSNLPRTRLLWSTPTN